MDIIKVFEHKNSAFYDYKFQYQNRYIYISKRSGILTSYLLERDDQILINCIFKIDGLLYKLEGFQDYPNTFTFKPI